MEYTKGEWKAREIPAGGWIIESNLPAPTDLFELPAKPRVFMSFTDDGKIACDITYERCMMFPNSFQGNQEANAHLIAAAPDMYEALKGLHPCMRPVPGRETPYEWAVSEKAMIAVREALAKAGTVS